MVALFPSHGHAAIRVEGRLLIADIEGPWNLELIREYQAMMRTSVEHLAATGPWGLIIVIRHAALCPPDAIAAIREGALAQARGQKRACTAYVIGPGVEGRRLMDGVWRGIYADIIPFEIFEKLEEAIAWSSEILGDHDEVA